MNTAVSNVQSKNISAHDLDLTIEMAQEICEAIANGASLRQALEPFQVARSQAYQWMRQFKWFAAMYERARLDQVETMRDEMQEIADDGTNDWEEKENKDGSTYIALNSEHVQRSRLRLDTRKWILERMNPRKYGPKAELAMTGAEGQPLIPTTIQLTAAPFPSDFDQVPKPGQRQLERPIIEHEAPIETIDDEDRDD